MAKPRLLNTHSKKWESYKLFLYVLPCLIFIFIFKYLPLWGWSYAFFQYKPGRDLFKCAFVGLQNFTALFGNAVMRNNLLRVLRNTFGIQILNYLLMPVPMLLFVQNTVSESVRWIPQVWIFLLYANAVLQGFLYFLFRIPFIDMLFITHLLLFTGGVSMILLLWKEYRKTQEKEVNLCLKAFGVLGISGVIALVLYWVLSIYWYESIFQFGILLYIAVLFWGLLCKVSNNIQFCLEQEIYRRMSLEDRMTDMKNRKSFEMYIEEIQEGAILLENVLLLFVKIAELKKINDISGRQMGDETVIRTARSIQSAERSVLEQQADDMLCSNK